MPGRMSVVRGVTNGGDAPKSIPSGWLWIER